jgi:phosphopantothenoylcysteine decarboxylase / phosphopantothenate---cysteine ligase
MLAGKRILLIIGGGIAAYKALELIRRSKERGAAVVPVLTRAGAVRDAAERLGAGGGEGLFATSST